MHPLQWPAEGVREDCCADPWSQPGSNLLLDFHGDPRNAGLVVFSDGNHHMALAESLQAFSTRYPAVGGVFYITTPPAPIVTLLKTGRLKIGNFVLSAIPHLFLSPPHVLDGLVEAGHMTAHRPFVKNRGSALLVRKGNPKRISGVCDLARPDVRLFLSNPQTEGVSHQGYVNTLNAVAARQGCDLSFLADPGSRGRICHGQSIHHREAPEAVAAGAADVAIVYHHLALRYVRIFPDHFEMVSLGTDAEDTDSDTPDVSGRTHAGLVGDGGRWGPTCLDFLFTRPVARIYAAHGLDALF